MSPTSIVVDPKQLSLVSTDVVGNIDLLILRMQLVVDLKGPLGLAANQLGELQRVVWVRDVGFVINPVLTVLGKATRSSREGCLSVPGKVVVKVRYYRVRLTGTDQWGVPISRKLKGLTAYVAQHEVDHLDGITI